MSNVVLSSLCKIYDDNFTAVHGATFEVQDGEFVVLVGPSGCGKSTTLRMIAGLESITSGELYIGGRLMNKVAPKDRDIAMVFQNYALYPHMSVFDNMGFSLKLRNFKKNEIRDRVKNAAKILGISEILEKKPKHLSGGQRQRVAVGRAIVRDPKVFLFDEPLSNLDAKLRVQMRMEISKLHQQLNATMIYVTHDQVEAMTMGDRIVVMKDGHIQQIDSPLNLYKKPVNRFVASFIGSPSMNFIEGNIIRDNNLFFHSNDGEIHLPVANEMKNLLEKYIHKDVVIGIRPEDIFINNSNNGIHDNPSAVMTLDVVEPMGNETTIYASSSENNIIASVKPQDLPDIGKEVKLFFNISNLHYFDKTTEQTITSDIQTMNISA